MTNSTECNEHDLVASPKGRFVKCKKCNKWWYE